MSTVRLPVLLLGTLSLQAVFLTVVSKTLKEGDCEVCVGVLNKLHNQLAVEERSNEGSVEAGFKAFCETAKGPENRFCYYIGGLEESATKIVSELSKPFSWGMPKLKVCEKLLAKDSQICDLKYREYSLGLLPFRYSGEYARSSGMGNGEAFHAKERGYAPLNKVYRDWAKVIDLKSVNLKKLKVKDLKKILSDWDEQCEGCVEKTDFVKRIEELKKVHVKEEL